MTRTVKIIPHPTTPGHWTILVTDSDGTENIYGCWNDSNNANVPTVMREQGCTEEQIAQAMQDLQHSKQVADKLETMGLVVYSRNHLLRMSKLNCRGEVCHHQWQTTISGNTYQYRDKLRAAGFQWYPLGNLWARPMGNGTIIEHLTDAREMLATW